MRTFDKYPGAKLVGISGTLSAGKDTAGMYLAKHHAFMHVSTGDVLRAEATRLGRDHERTTLIELAVEIHKTYDNLGALVLKAVDQWEKQREVFSGGLVVSGIRVLGEAEELKNQHGLLLFIDAPAEMRYQRLVERGRDSEASQSVEAFMAHEKIETEGLGGTERPHLRAVEAISDITIQNTGTEQEFIAKLDHILGY